MNIEIFTCITKGSSPYAIFLHKSLEKFKSRHSNIKYKFIESNNTSGFTPNCWVKVGDSENTQHNSLNHGTALNKVKNYIEPNTNIVIIVDADVAILYKEWDVAITKILKEYDTVSFPRPNTKYPGIFFNAFNYYTDEQKEKFNSIDFTPVVTPGIESVNRVKMNNNFKNYHIKKGDCIKCDTGWRIPLLYPNHFCFNCILSKQPEAQLPHLTMVEQKEYLAKTEHMAEWHFNGKLFGTHKQASRNHPLNTGLGDMWKRRIDLYTLKEYRFKL